MKLNIEEVLKISGYQTHVQHEIQFDSWDYLLNTKTGEFWYINDGFGEPEFMCIIDNIDHLKEVLSVLDII